MSKRKLHIDNLNAGDVATLGYRAHSWQSTFVGWVIEDGKPRAKFRDADGTDWDSYLFEGRMCVGSSADTLKVLDVVEPSALTQHAADVATDEDEDERMDAINGASISPRVLDALTDRQKLLLCYIINSDGSAGPIAEPTNLQHFTATYVLECVREWLKRSSVGDTSAEVQAVESAIVMGAERDRVDAMIEQTR